MVEGGSNRLWILASLVIVIGVVGSFVFVYGLMYSFASLGPWFFYALAALTIFSVFAAYSLYVGFRKRKWAIISIICIMIGVLLLTSSTFAVLPSSGVVTYPTQTVRNVFNATFSMGPDETRSFEKTNFWSIKTNSSLIQIRISSTSQQLDVELALAQNGVSRVSFLNATYSGGDQYGFDWHSYYWTPPGIVRENGPNVLAYSWNEITVTLHNLYNSQVQVQMQTDVFDKTTGQVETVNYHPLIDFQYAYAGMGLVGMALIPEAYAALRRNSKKTEKQT